MTDSTEDGAHQAWMLLVHHFKVRASIAESRAAEALRLLGDTLYFIADVHPDDRCLAVDEALAFHNKECPNRMVAPSGVGVFRMVQEHLLGDGESASKEDAK